MEESQEKSRLKRAIKHQSPKMQSYTYSPGDKVLVWREKIVNNRIGELIGPFTVLHHEERSKIVAIDQGGVIKRYSTSQTRPFLEQPSMLDDSITERKIEDRHEIMNQEPDEPDESDEPEYYGDNVQMNVDQ